MKKKKEQSRKKFFAEHLGKRQKSNICDFENHTSPPVRKERLSELNKARVEARRIKFVKNSGCSTESNAFNKLIVTRTKLVSKQKTTKRFAVKMLISPKHISFLTVSPTYNTQSHVSVHIKLWLVSGIFHCSKIGTSA